MKPEEIQANCELVYSSGSECRQMNCNTGGGYSFLVTCYNLQQFVSESIHSAFKQDWSDVCECVVVDDASTDGSLNEILSAVKDAPSGWSVRVYKNKRNLGVAKTYEHGIFFARQPWIVALDGDDIALPHRLSHVDAVLKEHPDVVLIADSLGSFGTRRDKPYPLIAVPNSDTRTCVLRSAGERSDALIGRRPWKGTYAGAFAFKKDAILRYGPLSTFNGHYRPTQDKIILYRAFLSGPVIATSDIVLLYRSHTTNLFHRLERFDAKTAREQHAVELRNYAMSGQHAASLRQCLQDIWIGATKPNMTDWSVKQLQEVEKRLKKDIAYYSLFSRYSLMPVFVRPFLLLANWRTLGPKRVKPFIVRLLPNLIFAKLKVRGKRKSVAGQRFH